MNNALTRPGRGAMQSVAARLRSLKFLAYDARRVPPVRIEDSATAHGSGDGDWKLWREGELFNQRFTATISEDGNRIESRWEYDAGDGWKTDFDLVYTRVSKAEPGHPAG